MGESRATMGLREIINAKRSIFLVLAVALIALAGAYIVYTRIPQPPRPIGDKAFYTVDDGRTWFVDSIYKTPPFDHEGKTAVRAMVYSYGNGRHEFCPFVQRYTIDVKKSLDDAVAQAMIDGKPLASVSLFNSPTALDGTEVKESASDGDWIPSRDKKDAAKIISSIKSPDGSAVDFVIP